MNDIDPFRGMPWLIKAIGLVGLPAVLSIFIIYTNETKIVTKVEATAQEAAIIKQTVESQNRILASVHDEYRYLREEAKTTNRLLTLVCSGVVKPELQKACWEK